MKRWGIVTFYVLLIYTTLGVVRSLSSFFESAGLLTGVTVVMGFLFTTLLLLVKRPPLGSKSYLLRCLILIVILVWGRHMEFVVERVHLVEYSFLGILCAWALDGSGHWPTRWPLAVGLVILIGYGDEGIQWLLPNRVYDLRDVIINALAGALGVALYGTFNSTGRVTNKGQTIKRFGLFLIIVGCLFGVNVEAQNRTPAVRFLAVGEGSATWIETAKGEHILIDCGNPMAAGTISARLTQAGVKRLAALIITHPHADHMGGIFALLDRFETGMIYDNGQPIDPLTCSDLARWYVQSVRHRTNYQVLMRGDRLVFQELTLAVLGPAQPLTRNWNQNSLVLRLVFGNKSVLLMADAGKTCEKTLLASSVDLKACGIQIGHHGAADASSRAFLEAVDPAWAIISIDRNNFRGYPAPATLKILENLGITTRITFRDGSCTWRPTLGGTTLNCSPQEGTTNTH